MEDLGDDQEVIFRSPKPFVLAGNTMKTANSFQTNAINVLSPKETKKFKTGQWANKKAIKKVENLNILEMDNDLSIPVSLRAQFKTP